MKTVCNIKEAAEATGLSEYALRQGIHMGEYPFIRAGRRLFVNLPLLEKAILEDMIATQEATKEAVKPHWERW